MDELIATPLQLSSTDDVVISHKRMHKIDIHAIQFF